MLAVSPTEDINHQIDTSTPEGKILLQEINYQRSPELKAVRNDRILKTKKFLSDLWNGWIKILKK